MLYSLLHALKLEQVSNQVHAFTENGWKLIEDCPVMLSPINQSIHQPRLLLPAGVAQDEPAWIQSRANSSPVVSSEVTRDLPPRPMTNTAARTSPQDAYSPRDAWDHPMHGGSMPHDQMQHPTGRHHQQARSDDQRWQHAMGPGHRGDEQWSHQNYQQPQMKPPATVAAGRAASAPIHAEVAQSAVPVAYQVRLFFLFYFW